jgi:hypothetical protein
MGIDVTRGFELRNRIVNAIADQLPPASQEAT